MPNNGPPVFLQHGLEDSSFTWVLNEPSQSLSYILFNAGYDVWFGNNRLISSSSSSSSYFYLLLLLDHFIDINYYYYCEMNYNHFNIFSRLVLYLLLLLLLKL